MYVILNDELAHHGIKGQKWGVRRFQNPDGSLKLAGRKRYGGYDPNNESYASKMQKRLDKINEKYPENARKKDRALNKEYKQEVKKLASEIEEHGKAVKKFEKDAGEKFVDSYNKASYKMNRELDRINNDPKFEDIDDPDIYAKYVKEISNTWKKIYDEQLRKDIGEHPDPDMKDWTTAIPFYDMYDNL